MHASIGDWMRGIECIREMNTRFPPVIELLKVLHNYKMFQIVGEVGNGALPNYVGIGMHNSLHTQYAQRTTSLKVILMAAIWITSLHFGRTKHPPSCSNFFVAHLPPGNMAAIFVENLTH